jgi:hypothetical protein
MREYAEHAGVERIYLSSRLAIGAAVDASGDFRQGRSVEEPTKRASSRRNLAKAQAAREARRASRVEPLPIHPCSLVVASLVVVSARIGEGKKDVGVASILRLTPASEILTGQFPTESATVKANSPVHARYGLLARQRGTAPR